MDVAAPSAPLPGPRNRKLRLRALLIFLGAIALLSFRLASPDYQVFDEYCYTSGAKALSFGLADTNREHPPLAKYLIATGIRVLGDHPAGWRAAPVFFGALALAVTFLLVAEVSTERRAWLAVAFVACNGFWFVMSRVAMLSIFEVAFALIAFLFIDNPILCGVALGLATACRWNGATAVALIVGYFLWRREVRKAFAVGAISVVTYFATWLPSTGLHLRQLIDAQLYILNFHRHAYGTAIAKPWFTWLTRMTPEMALNALLANPLLIVAGVISVAMLLAKREQSLIAIAALVFWLQWALIGRTFSYYYYFLDSVVFLSIAAALYISDRKVFGMKLSSAVVVLSFFWFAGNYANFTAPNVVEGLAVQAPACSPDQEFIAKAVMLEKTQTHQK
jgi:dolichyl-phosphate-mannose-protein mannosyltransferase